MAERLNSKIYVNGGYLDDNISVTSISELLEKETSNSFFLGQSIYMPEAFFSANEIPYPVDFWSVPNGEGIKWEIKNFPTIDSIDDLENFKEFINEFNTLAGYYPLDNGSEIIVDGTKYSILISEDKELSFVDKNIETNEIIEETVKSNIDKIVGGASESFDTLKEIEDWINNNGNITINGSQGRQGPQGPQGPKGNNGTIGLQGPQGDDGPQGPQGLEGPQGPQGAKGDDGFGAQGPQGPKGMAGANGSKGADGAQGNQGPKGAQGLAGVDGINGIDGAQGPQGPKGVDGAKGADGINGIDGAQGPQGPKGVDGANGVQGPKGDAGTIDDETINIIKEDIYNSLSENVKLYTDGIAVDINDENNSINVKISESEDNFLGINENNELEVKEITLDAAKTSKDIVVEGGQWADAVKTVYGGSVPAGTTWESFLEAMLCVEKFADSITTSTAFTVSCGNINPGIDKSGTVEVGTKVTLGKTTANSTTASQSLTAKTFTYGYKLGEDGSHNGSTTYIETLTPSKVESNDALKITFSNFKDAVNDGNSIDEKTGNGSIDSVEMYAMEGTNKVIVYQTGDTYTSSSAVTAGTIYVATNLKNYYKSDKSTPNTYTPTFVVTSKTASDSTEYTVTGAHKYYIGDVTEYSDEYWNTDRSEVIRGLSTYGWATSSNISKVEHIFGIGTKQQTVVIPSSYNTVSGVDANNGTVTFNFIKEIDFTNEQGYISKYKVFVAPSQDGLTVDSKIIITISK